VSTTQALAPNETRTFVQGIVLGAGVFVGMSIAQRSLPGPHRLLLLETEVRTDAGGNSRLHYTVRNPDQNDPVEFFRTSIIVTA
jgi:hypothetical protein